MTGLTSNPTIFDHAIKNSAAYDAAIRAKLRRAGRARRSSSSSRSRTSPRAADLFRPVHERTDGVDGWVSLEVSPLLAYDTTTHDRAAQGPPCAGGRPNLFIKIPGTKEGLPAIEEAIFAGVPVNVTLLFSREHYLAAAEAYLRGIERRIAAGLDAGRRLGRLALRQPLGRRGGGQGAGGARATGSASRSRSARTRRTASCSPRRGSSARSTRARGRSGCCWASTGTKDPKASDILYVKALAAPLTVNTMPEGTLQGVRRSRRGRSGHAGRRRRLRSGRWRSSRRPGIDVDALAAQLQDEGAKSFVEVVERADGGDRVQERGAREGGLTGRA